MQKIPFTQSLKILLTICSGIIIIAGLKASADLLVTVMLGVFLAFLSMPMLNGMVARGVPHILSVIITVAGNIAIFTALILAGSYLFDGFRGEVQRYAVGLSDHLESLAVWLEDSFDIEGARDMLTFNPTEVAEFLQGKEFLSGIAVVGSKVFGTVASVLSTMFFVFILMIFILMESRGVDARLEAVRRSHGPDLRGMLNVAGDIQKYLAIKTVVSAVTGGLAILVCWAADVPTPVLWGLVAFFLNFIPAIGSVLAGIPPVLIALAEHGVWPSLGVLAGYLAINVMLGNFIEPTLLGKRFGVSTLVVILSVLFWGWLWGPVGMFLAVPLTMMLKVVFETIPDLRWISVAMAKRSPELYVMAGMVDPDAPPPPGDPEGSEKPAGTPDSEGAQGTTGST